MATREEVQEEVSRNYEFFLKERAKIPQHLLNKCVLIRNKEFIEYFDSIGDAEKYAKKVFEDGLYSIQKINDIPVNLGFVGVFIDA